MFYITLNNATGELDRRAVKYPGRIKPALIEMIEGAILLPGDTISITTTSPPDGELEEVRNIVRAHSIR